MRSLVLLGLFLSLNTFAQEPHCKQLIDDDFEPAREMVKGPRAGHCLDTSQIRPLQLIALNQDNAFVANVSHAGQFWTGEIELTKEAIKRAIFIIESFPPEAIAAHTELRFDFNLGHEVILRGQNETNLNEVRKLSSIVISFEAWDTINGPGYSFTRGMKDYFALAPRLVSLEDIVQVIVVKYKHKNKQVELNLNSEETLDVLKGLLEKGDRIGRNDITYHTIKRNCTNQLFQVLDRVLEMKRGMIRKMSEFLPIWSKGILKRRKLIREELPSLEVEFPQ